MGLFDIFKGKPPEPKIRERVTDYCPTLVAAARQSVQRWFGSHADEFDSEMASYTALGVLLTFVVAHVADEARSHPVTMAVLDYASAHGIQREAVAVVHARLKVNFESNGSLTALPADIRRDLAAISPEHSNVFTDIVAEIQSSITRLLQ